MLPEASGAGRGGRRALHRRTTSSASPRRPSTISSAGKTDEAQIKRACLGHREGRTRTWQSKARNERSDHRPHPARHGGRRPGRLHRRRASPRGAHGRSLRIRGGRACPPIPQGARPRARNWAWRRTASIPTSRRWPRPRPSARTASRRCRSSRRTTCMCRPPRPSSRPASMSSATSRWRSV